MIDCLRLKTAFKREISLSWRSHWSWMETSMSLLFVSLPLCLFDRNFNIIKSFKKYIKIKKMIRTKWSAGFVYWVELYIKRPKIQSQTTSTHIPLTLRLLDFNGTAKRLRLFYAESSLVGDPEVAIVDEDSSKIFSYYNSRFDHR